MKKILLVMLVVFGISVPAFAFSVTAQVQATYSMNLGSGLSAGVLGRLSAGIITSPFSLGLLLRPFIQYDTTLVENGPMSVTAFARVRVPITIGLVNTSFKASIDPQAGVDLTYDLGNNLSVLAGAEFDTSFQLAPSTADPFSFSLNGYAEIDYVLNPATLFFGVFLAPLPSPFGWNLYLGANTNLASNMTLLTELDTNFQFFDVLIRLAFRI